MTIAYNNLEDRYKDIINEVRVKIGDTDDNNPFLDNDTYAILLTADVVDDINETPPVTELGISDLYIYRGLLALGLRVYTYGSLIDKYVEIPDFEGLNVAQANRRDFIARWKSSFDIWSARFDQKKKIIKRRMMPGPRLSVGEDYYGIAGIRNWGPPTRRRPY